MEDNLSLMASQGPHLRQVVNTLDRDLVVFTSLIDKRSSNIQRLSAHPKV